MIHTKDERLIGLKDQNLFNVTGFYKKTKNLNYDPYQRRACQNFLSDVQYVLPKQV